MAFDDADDWVNQLERAIDILEDPEVPYQKPDREFLWSLHREINGYTRLDERQLQAVQKKLRDYLNDTCLHAMVVYRAKPDDPYPTHRQCFFCNEVEFDE